MRAIDRSLPLVVILFIVSCSASEPAKDPPHAAADPLRQARRVIPLGEFESPAPIGAAEPNLALGTDGRPHLTWLEPADPGYRLRVAIQDGDGWTAPTTIVEHAAMLANWADFPSIVAREDGNLVAHWLLRRPDGQFAYDIRFAISRDAGATWSVDRPLNDDDTPTEHGFASLVAWPNGQVGATWLDGRKMTGDHGGGEAEGEMSLRFARLAADGQVDRTGEIDARVCECCGTAAVAIPGGMAIFYRNRSDGEVRDINRVRVSYTGATMEDPLAIADDNWQLGGCPVNGPAADVFDSTVAVAWFTEAADLPRVQVAFSSNAGQVFAPPVEVARDTPLGRVSLVLVDPRTALVGWLDGAGDSAAIRVRRVSVSGELGPPIEIARTSAARQSGFPRMVAAGHDAVLVAWTDASGADPRIRVTRVQVSG